MTLEDKERQLEKIHYHIMVLNLRYKYAKRPEQKLQILTTQAALIAQDIIVRSQVVNKFNSKLAEL